MKHGIDIKILGDTLAVMVTLRGSVSHEKKMKHFNQKNSGGYPAPYGTLRGRRLDITMQFSRYKINLILTFNV